MILQVLQVIHLTGLCLVNTTVLMSLLLLSLRGLPKTPLTTSNGVSEAFSARVMSVNPQKIENLSTHHPNPSKYYMKSIPNFDSIGVA